MLIFTNDDYRRIQAWLKKNAIKDSDFAISQETVPEEDILVITLNMATVPTNYKIKIKDLLNSSLGKVVINSIIAKSVKVNNLLTVDASNIKLDNKNGVTLQNVLDYFDDNKLNRHTDDTLDGNLTIKKNITIEGNIKSNDGTTTIEADLKATGEITDGNDNILSDVNDAAKQWSLEYQDPQQDEPTVRAKYVLKDYKGVPKGDIIKVYKDSAITNVYLGTTEDTCNENTGEVTKKPIQNNNEALSIVYRLDTGKYSLVNVPIGIFIKEAEFDKYRGLGITENGQVFIKLANDVESSNYLHFNNSGEISADGIENRILQDLGTIINSVAGDGTMWGQYKKEEGTKDSPTNEASRWGQYKQAEADRNERLNNLENKIEEEKTAIIDTNRIANGAVTIPKLSADIQALIANLSKNAVFAGIATPTTNPGTPDGPVFYFAVEAGTYSNFNGITIGTDEAALLVWNGGATWEKEVSGFVTRGYLMDEVARLDETDNEIKADLKAEVERATAAEQVNANSINTIKSDSSTLFSKSNNGMSTTNVSLNNAEYISIKGYSKLIIHSVQYLGKQVMVALYNSKKEDLEMITRDMCRKLKDGTYECVLYLSEYTDAAYMKVICYQPKEGNIDISKCFIAYFKDVELSELENGLENKLGKKDSPEVGYEFFSYNVDVIIGDIEDLKKIETIKDEPSYSTDYACVRFSSNYSRFGEPSKLVIYNHGAGGKVTESFSEITTSLCCDALVKAGYCLLEVNGYPVKFHNEKWNPRWASGVNMGSPMFLRSVAKALSYVEENYNIDCRNVAVIGRSMGGLAALNLCNSGLINPICIALDAPVIDLFNDAWNSGDWVDGSLNGGTRLIIAMLYGFDNCNFEDGTFSIDNGATYKNFSDKNTDDLNALYNNNIAKIIGYNPFVTKRFKNFNDDDAIFLPACLKIWVGDKDGTNQIGIANKYIEMCRNAGIRAQMRTVPTTQHVVWNKVTSDSDVDISVTYKELTISPYTKELINYLEQKFPTNFLNKLNSNR